MCYKNSLYVVAFLVLSCIILSITFNILPAPCEITTGRYCNLTNDLFNGNPIFNAWKVDPNGTLSFCYQGFCVQKQATDLKLVTCAEVNNTNCSAVHSLDKDCDPKCWIDTYGKISNTFILLGLLFFLILVGMAIVINSRDELAAANQANQAYQGEHSRLLRNF